MLTVEAARKIGIDACIDKIGRDFVRANKDSAVFAWGGGEAENSVYCYVGVDDKPIPPNPPGVLILDNTSKFPYSASCFASRTDGAIKFIECVLPA